MQDPMHDASAARRGREAAERWDTVRRWRGLRGEAKLAWLTLWEGLGRPTSFDARFSVSAALLAYEQGTMERCGRRVLTALHNAGLIDITSRLGGQYEGFMLDPLIVATGRRVSAADAGQAELDFGEKPELQPEATTEAGATALPYRLPNAVACPADRAPLPPDAADRAPLPPPQTSKHDACARIETLSIQDIQDMSCAADRAPLPPREQHKAHAWELRHLARRSQQAAADPPALADDVGQVMRRLPTPTEQQAQIDRLAGWLKTEIDDAATHERVYRRIAIAVCEGVFPRAKLDQVLLSVRKARGKLNRPGAYFMAAIKTAFQSAGLDWREASSKQGGSPVYLERRKDD